MKYPFLCLLFCLYLPAVQAQEKKAITLDDVWKRPVWQESGIDDLNYSKISDTYTAFRNGDLEQYDIRTGNRTRTLVEQKELIWQNSTLNPEGYHLNTDESLIILETETEPLYRRSSRSKVFLFDLKTRKLQPVFEGKKIYLPEFSPDGRYLCFGFENNLYLQDMKTGKAEPVTRDGKINEKIHGSTDWVYEEEFEFWKAWAWSPDSRKIAFLSFDESLVPEYNMQMWGGLYPQDYRFKYPKAGEKNSRADLSFFDVETRRLTSVEEGAESDQYLPRFQWTKNPGILSLLRMNRLQNKLELLHVDAASGKITPVLTETSATYVDITDDLRYLNNGKEFIWSSDRSGYNHLYLYGTDGTLIRPLTSGNWEVTRFHGVDEKKGLVFYTGTEAGSIQRQLYSVGISGKNKKQVTTGAGTHEVSFNPLMTYYIDDHHSSARPSVYTLCQASGQVVKVVEKNQNLVDRLAGYRISPKTFMEIPIGGGMTMNAWIIKPPGFDPSRKYPVLMHCYGGPGHQTVLDGWGGPDFFWYQVLAEKGYIIVSADNRGTGGKGSAFRKSTYGDMGRLEWEDQSAFARYLKNLPYVDGSRIGIWGWSFGGYLTSLCLTKSPDLFKAGIAVAPVTNWRFYDSIYTERYLKLPSENASGYDENSPVTYADRLKGNYLIVHGTGDDNVHFQNAVAMVNALVKANIPFESFFYPNRNHGIYGQNARPHLYRMMTDFLERKL